MARDSGWESQGGDKRMSEVGMKQEDNSTQRDPIPQSNDDVLVG